MPDGALHDATEPMRNHGSAFPVTISGSTGSTVTASRTSCQVASPIRISPSGAACSNRAATFIASPGATVRPNGYRRPPPRQYSRQSVLHSHPPTAHPVSGDEVECGSEFAGGTDGAKCVILVGHGHAKDRDNGIADELLNRPTVS